MSVTLIRVGKAVVALQGASSLLEGQEVVLFTASDLKNLDRGRREEVDLQMPSFLRAAPRTKTPRIYLILTGEPIYQGWLHAED
jgi:hypothetical protein